MTIPSFEATVRQANTSVDDISWNILGQTYVPKHVTESSFSWHATFPPGTFVPPHIHHTQDEFIYLFEGSFDLVLDGQETKAKPGDLVCMPKGIAHGIFNKSDQQVKCLFWVSPTAKLWELFEKINKVGDPSEVVRIANAHELTFLPPR